ncbi:MAG: Amidohydrolase [Betaproteobacteria bacterium ADurb.Bin341]|nr:MAG: Amidohydrolase [Betaproteobacteria bacterium ADurb.Bin341]
MAKPVLINPCRAALSPELQASPWLAKVWQGLEVSRVWDCHTHVAGTGDSGSGIAIGPQLTSLFYPAQYAKRLFFLNAGCVRSAPGQADLSYVARMRNLIDGMPAGFKAILFAFDHPYDEAGHADLKRASLYVPDAYVQRLVRESPNMFEWAASIHPYRADALDALQAAIAVGACAVKWLPPAMGMDPSSPRCERFYRVLAEHRLPLIVHCGKEEAVKGVHLQHFGNPLLLRRALDAGVRVVVAHCASYGTDKDIDSGGGQRSSFELFARLLCEPRAKGLLHADISAVILNKRPLAVLKTLLERQDWHPVLLNGSDYPVPGILPLISPARLAREGLLPEAAVGDLELIREHNPLLFDIAVKRLLSWQGRKFPASVFETRGFFERKKG